MERKRRNLFLFFEENDDEKDISSSLVHLYMNRFVIAEEDQIEIIGVYNLANPNKNTPMIEFNSQDPFEPRISRDNFEGENFRATQFWKEKRTKLVHDQSVFRGLGSEIIKADVESVKVIQSAIQSAIKEIDSEIQKDDIIQRFKQQLATLSNLKSIFYNSVNH